ncbi:hypothetical protein [Bacillus tuaregi]|uniref:hypothetical protein n=1 Tax=Bacillus tuaregi TaxID=1816695 RepID=UPI0008F859CA|nr:hypothetical protein [Bacillus tuaregi]
MLLYHPIRKTYDDFDEIFEYWFDGKDGSSIETDKELSPGNVVILRGLADYAIIITDVWEEDGKRCFSHDSAEKIVVRARPTRNRDLNP